MSGALPGPLLAPFWRHFRVILGLLLKCFGVFSVMFPSLGSRYFFFENVPGGAAEDHLKCKKRSGIHSDRALLFNALPVPLLRQVSKITTFSVSFLVSF